MLKESTYSFEFSFETERQGVLPDIYLIRKFSRGDCESFISDVYALRPVCGS